MDTRSRKVRKSTVSVAFHHTALINTHQPCSMYIDIPSDTRDESFSTSNAIRKDVHSVCGEPDPHPRKVLLSV